MLTKKCNRRASPRKFRPLFEILEDRNLLALITWTGQGEPDVSGNQYWSDSDNWTPRRPASGDVVSIGQSGGEGRVLYDIGASELLTLQGLICDKPLEMFGTLTLNGPGTFRFSNTLILTGGFIGGDGTIDVAGQLNWSRGNMGGSGITNANGGIRFQDFPIIADSRVINNAGAATFIGGPGGFVNASGFSVFNNLATGSFIIDGTNDFSGSFATFNNLGTFIKRGGGTGDDATRLAVRFNQLSTTPVLIEGGILQISGGTHTGAFEFTGATLELGPSGPLTSNFNAGSSVSGTTLRVTGGSTHNFNAGSTYNVTGASDFMFATTTFDGTVTSVGALTVQAAANFNQDITTSTLALTGVLGGSATVNVSGPITWSSGAMRGSGVTNANGGLAMGGQLAILDSRTINNAGAATYNGTLGNFFNNSLGAVFNNLATGVFTIDGNNDYNGGAFNNNGMFIKRAGAVGDGVTRFGLTPFTNRGSVTIGGTLDSTGSYTQLAGSTTLQNGTLLLTTSNIFANLNLNGGLLAGSGLITGNVVNAGTVSPGLPAGVLTIIGNYTQTATGVLNLDIGGLTAGTNLDQMDVRGTIRLDGALNVSLTNGFTPAAGNAFPVMLNDNTDAITNNFTDLPDLTVFSVGAGFMRITYTGGTGNDMILHQVNQAPTADAGTYDVDEGTSSVTLTGSATDPDGDPLNYIWDLDSDGIFETPGQVVTLSTAGIDGPNFLTPVLAVTDGQGGSATSTAIVTVNNVAPTAAHVVVQGLSNGDALEGATNVRVVFGVEMDPSSADVLAGFRYAFDFNDDGTFEIGGATYAASSTSPVGTVPASFIADGPADVQVRVRIYDDDDGFTSYRTGFSVRNIRPTAVVTSSGSADEGSTATVSFINQFDPSPTDTAAGFRYAYDFDDDGFFDIGDGTYAGSSPLATVAIPAEFLTDGPIGLSIRARIIDKDNGFDSGDSHTGVFIRNVAPTAVLSNGGPVLAGSTATVSFSGQFDPSPEDTSVGFTYSYDFNNDSTFEVVASTSPSATVPAAFLATPGVHTVGARIFDKDGDFTAYTTAITVIGVPGVPNTVVWSGASGVSGNWSDPGNWAGGVAPVAGNDLVFPSAAARFANNNDFPIDTTFHSITVGGGDYTLRGNRLILGNGGLAVNGGNHVLSFGIRSHGYELPAPVSTPILVAQASALELSGVLGGALGLYKTGAGALILSGANTYTGATWVAEGVLGVRHALALGSTNSGTQICGGARLDLQSGLTIANESLTLEDPDPEKGGQVVPGPAVLAIVTGGSALAPTSWNGPVHLNPGNPQTRVDEGAVFEVSGVISGVGNLHKTGPGTLIFSGANTYIGATRVDEGVLTLRHSMALGSTAAGAELHGGTTLVLENNVIVADDLVLVGDPPGTVLPAVRVISTGTNTVSGKLAVNPLLTLTTLDGTLTMAGVISGDDDLVKDGPGTLVLSAANTYTGVTHVLQGVLTLRNSLALGATSAGAELHGGTTLVLQDNITVRDDLILVGDPPGTPLPAVRVVSTGTNSVAGKIATNPLVAVTVPNGTLTIAGLIDGNDNLIKDGAGTLVLTADNTLHGAITVLAGTLLVNGSQPSTPIVVQGGVLGGTGLLGPITMNGGQLQGPVIQASPIYPGLHDLVVGGTAGDDVILFLPAANPSKITIVVNGQSLVRPRPTGHVIAFAGAGHDVVLVTPALAVPTLLYGESGNDVLWGGSGNDLLFGGAGHDVLWGGSGDDVVAGGEGNDALFGEAGRDVLIGGSGSDYLFGLMGDDILIAGTTDFDADVIALHAVMLEWRRENVSYEQRIAHLEHGGGLNGGTHLNDATVHDDGSVDSLSGSSGRDWFFANWDGAIRDIVTDRQTIEDWVDVD